MPGGGRRYWYVRVGGSGSSVRYVKVVDAHETTLSFVQEVYDSSGRLHAIHAKYPTDTGHCQLPDEVSER